MLWMADALSRAISNANCSLTRNSPCTAGTRDSFSITAHYLVIPLKWREALNRAAS